MSAATEAAAQPRAEVEPRALLGLSLGEVVLRFLFGAVASFAAGVVSLAFGARTGGMALALPVILVASITLEQRKGGRDAVRHELAGAPIGALGMVTFAAAVVGLLGRLPLAGVLALAVAAWALTSVVVYLLVEALRRRRSAAGADHHEQARVGRP